MLTITIIPHVIDEITVCNILMVSIASRVSVQCSLHQSCTTSLAALDHSVTILYWWQYCDVGLIEPEFPVHPTCGLNVWCPADCGQWIAHLCSWAAEGKKMWGHQEWHTSVCVYVHGGHYMHIIRMRPRAIKVTNIKERENLKWRLCVK